MEGWHYSETFGSSLSWWNLNLCQVTYGGSKTLTSAHLYVTVEEAADDSYQTNHTQRWVVRMRAGVRGIAIFYHSLIHGCLRVLQSDLLVCVAS